MDEITKSKQYCYRNGLRAEVVSLDGGPSGYPVVSIESANNKPRYHYHDIEGRTFGFAADDFDLVEVIDEPAPEVPEHASQLLKAASACLTRLSIETADSAALELSTKIRSYIQDHAS